MWRQECWPETLLSSEPACRPVPRLTLQPVLREVCSLLTIVSCKRCLPNRPLSRQISRASFLLVCKPAHYAVPRPLLRFLFTQFNLLASFSPLPQVSYQPVLSTSASPTTSHSLPPIVLASIFSSVAASLFTSQSACTCQDASLNFLAFTTASLSGSVFSNALTSTSLRVWRYVSLSFCTLSCMQESLLVPRLAHYIVCLHFS